MSAGGTGTNGTTMLPMGDIALFSLKTVANVLLQFSLAIVLAYTGYITDSDVEGLSRVMNYILVPLVAFASIGSRLSQEIFMQEGWILAVIGLLACFEFFALGWMLRPIAKPSDRFKRLFCVMMALPNLIALPVEITQTLCQLGVFEADFADVADCNAQALLYIFMYIAFNNFCIWIFFFNYLQEGNRLFPPEDDPGVEANRESDAPRAENGTGKVPGPVPGEASATGCGAVMWRSVGSPLNGLWRKVFARPHAEVEAENATSDPGISESGQSTADAIEDIKDGADEEPPKSAAKQASFEVVPKDTTAVVCRKVLWKRVGRPVKNTIIQVFTRPPVLGSVLGLVVGLIPELQYVIFGEGAPLEPLGIAVTSLSQATVPVINLVMAFSIGLKLKEVENWTGLLGSKEVGAEPRTIVSSVMMRGLVLPGIHFALVYAAFPILPENRLFRLVLFVSAICPTASIVVALAHIAGLSDLAKIAAFAIIPQYILAIPGLVLFLTAALLAIS